MGRGAEAKAITEEARNRNTRVTIADVFDIRSLLFVKMLPTVRFST